MTTSSNADTYGRDVPESPPHLFIPRREDLTVFAGSVIDAVFPG